MDRVYEEWANQQAAAAGDVCEYCGADIRGTLMSGLGACSECLDEVEGGADNWVWDGPETVGLDA
jgi:ribosomal protein L37AE/L43A